MAFEIASTNLVIELGIILAILMGWQFTAAEFVGGPIMIVVLALVLRRAASRKLVSEARSQAEKGLRGYMEGHAAMDMSVSGGTLGQRILSPRGFTAISHLFVMDWAAVLRDVVGGLLIAGALAAWVPDTFWRGFFITDQPQLAALWGPLVGPLISVISFVCSIGNVPLAAVLWNGGISFGGVVSFIFADLIILPILSIKRRYYGARMTVVLFLSFYAAMAFAGFVVELLFGALGLVPTERRALVTEATVALNYTSVLNVAFLALAVILLVRAYKTGVGEMVAMMA